MTIVKVSKTHKSLTSVLPKEICEALQLKHRDYVCYRVEDLNKVIISKVIPTQDEKGNFIFRV